MERFRPYLQLIRLPAVPTALADIFLAALAMRALPERWFTFLLLCLTSACLYSGGMIFNDFFDVEQDRRERPHRPIPSGHVTRRMAGFLGTVMLAAGVLFSILAWLSNRESATVWTIVLAVLLVGAILLYDGPLKRTPVGPAAMGLCRFLNVLLGLTVAGQIQSWGVYLALVVGLYVAGVTWFARTEARTSSQTALLGAAGVMLVALLLTLPVPVLPRNPNTLPAVTSSFAQNLGLVLFPYLVVALGFVIGLPLAKAITGPTPRHVQAAVKRALLGLVILDAVLATALAGAFGLLVLLLVVPILLLGRWRWLYAT
jgi:4-hydroxybenzoate polyprenyltransferase